MKALATLTPTESKKLISQAILAFPGFQEAWRDGIVAIHPSSNTYFLYEALTGQRVEGTWVSGVVTPRGLCVSKESLEGRIRHAAPGSGPRDPLSLRTNWFFKKGCLQESTALGEIIDQMTERDFYIKGANAVDPAGNVAVLFGNPAGGGGTIGKVIVAQRRIGFQLLLPIGLEKLIPVPVATAAQKVSFGKIDRAMGLPCGLIPVPGRKIDEVDALTLLSGAEVTPVAAGGLGGAEGSIVLAINGADEQVEKAFEICRSVKGTRLPELNLLDCEICWRVGCHFAVKSRDPHPPRAGSAPGGSCMGVIFLDKNRQVG
ncbi:MAG: hypothetical protein M0009_08080 [Deltaproteobacteria bacterium]|nr:hypothetical protein [Deltaproteobacteria bacterium]